MDVCMVIAECPRCGQRYFGFSEEEARDRYYSEHDCPLESLDNLKKRREESNGEGSSKDKSIEPGII